MDKQLLDRARQIQLAVFDVDGVFTDGRLYYGAQGEALKVFNVQDGHGIKALLEAGIETAVISGRSSPLVSARMSELGVQHVYQGCSDKLSFFQALLKQLALEPQQALCLGDDRPDLPLLQNAGLACAPADAHPDLRAAAHWITPRGGGAGAVRDVCDLLLAAHGITTTTQA